VNTGWRTLNSCSAAETEGIGRMLAQRLTVPATVALHGDLGCGKTVLARGIARGLGVAEPITSPTFAIAQEYACPQGIWLYHLDLYRIDDEEQALAFGIDEYLFAADAVCVLEWPERIPHLLGVPAVQQAGRLVRIEIEHVGPQQRRLRLPADLADGT